MFEPKSVDQFLFLVRVLSKGADPLGEEWRREAWNLVIEFAFLLPREAQVDWGELAERVGLNLRE